MTKMTDQRPWMEKVGWFGVAIAIQTLALVQVKGNQYDKKFNMAGKLTEKYQPYGVWYDDLTSTKSQDFIQLVQMLCQDVNITMEITFSCEVFRFKDKTSGAWADFNVTMTSLLRSDLNDYGYKEMRILLRSNLSDAFSSVYQRIDHIIPGIDRSWMLTLAIVGVGMVGSFCIVLAVIVAIRIILEERKAEKASQNKANLLKEYENIKREKTRPKSKKRTATRMEDELP